MSILEAKNITKIYAPKRGGLKVKALNNFSMTVEEGEFIGVMGPSGSGKTTLLNILATLDYPSSGEIRISNINPSTLNDKEISLFRRREIGFIFQDFNLLESLSIKENILLPLALEKVEILEIEQRLRSITEFLDIRSILGKRVYEVSGGQKQKVACARALINNPSIIFADEPTGSLDSKSAYDIMDGLSKLNKDKKATILMVTHDPFVASFCNKVIMIKDGSFFLDIVKRNSRETFFKEIIDSLSLLGDIRRSYNDLK
ncbi:ABC transporter ATP-binding protein [Clostridium intestinale]|uniref:ABC transporter ATP-binding protein n=1 Tax=Clostridium intestinale URNW TaxID=1294142 RepID=U2PS81_9CLOT|nr:ABC transporter ATP-binding protein [Clostridium intestinale]ERK29320.1 ABC transporter ATP-binding protein [Clostridium intestinale URNW]